MEKRSVLSRAGLVAAVVVGMLVGMTVLPGAASMENRPPTPSTIVDPENPDQYIAQVNPDGALQVAGQVNLSGSSDVNVKNFPAVQSVNGTVDIGNLPAVQEVKGTVNTTTPVATATRHISTGSFDGIHSKEFATINARVISISTDSDELSVHFYMPFNHTTSAFHFGTNRTPPQVTTLPVAVPIDRVGIVCMNEAEDCIVDITILG